MVLGPGVQQTIGGVLHTSRKFGASGPYVMAPGSPDDVKPFLIIAADGTVTPYYTGTSSVSDVRTKFLVAMSALGPGETLDMNGNTVALGTGTGYTKTGVDNWRLINGKITRDGSAAYTVMLKLDNCDNVTIDVEFDGLAGWSAPTDWPPTHQATSPNPVTSLSVALYLVNCEGAQIKGSFRDHVGYQRYIDWATQTLYATSAVGRLPLDWECYALYVENGCKNCHVSANFSKIGQIAIVDNGEGTVIEDCLFDDIGWHGVAINIGSTVINNCTFQRLALTTMGFQGGVDANVSGAIIPELKITNCTFHMPYDINAGYTGGSFLVKASKCEKITLANSTFTHGTGLGTGDYDSFRIEGEDVGDIVISDCILSSGIGHILADGPTRNSRSLTIRNTTINAAQPSEPWGVRLTTKNLKMDGCTVYYQNAGIVCSLTSNDFGESLECTNNEFISDNSKNSYAVWDTCIDTIYDRIVFDETNYMTCNADRSNIGAKDTGGTNFINAKAATAIGRYALTTTRVPGERRLNRALAADFAHPTDIQIGADKPSKSESAGTPVGVVSAYKASEYTQTDGTSGSIKWIATESGSGNWQAVAVDQLTADTYADLFALDAGDKFAASVDRYSASHVKGDGSGRNDLVYDAGSSATIDGGFVFPGIGGVMTFDSAGVFNGTPGTGRWLAADATSVGLMQFGVLDNVAAQTEPMQRAFYRASQKGVTLTIPPGTFKFDDTIMPFALGTMRIRGAGRDVSILDSTCVGVPALFFGNSGYLDIEGFSLKGTGTSGHGISLIDPATASGTYLPQQVIINNIEVNGFAGTDTFPTYGTDVPFAMDSCALVAIDGLQMTISNSMFYSSKIGIYLYETGTVRIDKCAIVSNTLAGIVSQRAEVSSITQCDIIGNGTTATATMTLPYASQYTANHIPAGIMSIDDWGTEIKGNKLKSNASTCIYVNSVHTTLVQGNWIRASLSITPVNPMYGVYSTSSARIVGNDFYPTNNNAVEAQVAIEYVAGVACAPVEITNNRMILTSGAAHASVIRVVGNGNGNYPVSGLIADNYIGSPYAPSNAVVITDCYDISGHIGELVIRDNALITNNSLWTVTDVFDFSGVLKPSASYTRGVFSVGNNRIQNVFLTSTITNEYVMPTDANARVIRNERGFGTPEGAILASIGSEYTQTDGTAGSIKWIKTSGTGNTGWVAQPAVTTSIATSVDDATPNVALIDALLVVNTVSTTITNFDGAAAGQKISVIAQNNNVTFAHGTLWLDNGIDWTPGVAGGALNLVYDDTYSVWREIGRTAY